jgi:hypothetical protein
MGQPYASFGRLAERASRLGSWPGRCLAEQRELILVWYPRAEHPQHPIQLVLFGAIRGSDCMPQSA